MATVFHAWLYGRFIEIQSNLRRKKLHRTNQTSNFLGGSFNNRDYVRAPIQFRTESQPQHLKSWFSLRTDPSIFTSIAPVLLDWSNESSWVFVALKSISHFLPQSNTTSLYFLSFPMHHFLSFPIWLVLILRKKSNSHWYIIRAKY